MKLRFPETEIEAIANEYSYARNEDELLAIAESVHHKGFVSKPELQKLGYWKSPRSSPKIERNSDQFVEEITKFSFATKDERARIEVLTLLDGVKWPTASVILHLYHREPYPILDFRALWSVGIEVIPTYNFHFWNEYTEYCRSLAKRSGVDMRTLDRALWQYSKENQKDDVESSS